VPQLHAYVSKRVADRLRARARARGIPISRHLAELIERDVGGSWPEGYFEEVVGRWQGPPLRRPRQGRLEQREDL
jgi:hypothetical protein